MTESTHPVIAAAQRYRQNLLDNERQSATRLVAAYGRAYVRMGDSIAQLEARLSAGVDSEFYRTRVEALRSLRLQAVDEINRFAVYADQEITANARAAIAQGIADSGRIVGAHAGNNITARQALSAGWDMLPSESVETMLGFLSPDSPLHTRLVGILGETVAQRMETALVDAIAEGFNPRKTAEIARRELGVGLTWALNTARTAQMYAYREATRANYMANSDVVTGWRWYSALDRRVCFACLSQHGRSFPVTATLNGHHSCRCLTAGQMVITEQGEKAIESIVVGDRVLTHKGRYRTVTRISQRRHDGVVYTFTQDGASVITTPEHPLLTQRGWVEAKDCNALDTFSTLKDVLVLASNRNTVQPSSESRESLFASLARLSLARCQCGSHSTASFDAGNAKSILYPSTASWGVQVSPASLSAARNFISPGEQYSRQLSCLHFAVEAARRAVVSDLKNLSLNAAGSASTWRLAATLGEMGAMLWSFIQRMSVRVLTPSSEHISRYVAFSSMYRRLSHLPNGSPSFDSISVSNLDDMSSPHFLGSLLSPNAFARCKTPLCDLFGNSLATSWCSMVSKLATMIASSSSVQKYISNPFTKRVDDYGIIIHQQENKIKESIYSGIVYNLQVDEDESYIAGGIVVHNCTMIPDVPLTRRLGITEPYIESGEQWFRRQLEDVQLEMMGSGMFDAWQLNQFRFSDLNQLYRDTVYGTMLRQPSLKDLLSRGAPPPFGGGNRAPSGQEVPSEADLERARLAGEQKRREEEMQRQVALEKERLRQEREAAARETLRLQLEKEEREAAARREQEARAREALRLQQERERQARQASQEYDATDSAQVRARLLQGTGDLFARETAESEAAVKMRKDIFAIGQKIAKLEKSAAKRTDDALTTQIAMHRAEMAALEQKQRTAERTASDLRRESKRLTSELLQVPDPMNVIIVAPGESDTTRQRIQKGADDFSLLVSRRVAPASQVVTAEVSSGDGSYFNPGTKSIVLGGNQPLTVTVHELGHWLEDFNPDMHRKALAFFDRRTAGETTAPLLGRDPSEVGKPDRFLSSYMGREYYHGADRYATEIVSMGLEYMYYNPVLLARADPDMFDFIFDLMRGR